MERFWEIVCFANMLLTPFSLWLCGHHHSHWEKGEEWKRLAGWGMVLVSLTSIVATSYYPKSLPDYSFWFISSLFGLFFGIAAWKGAHDRTKPLKG